jgi:predicted DNA-binding transcriptional regulator YafY
MLKNTMVHRAQLSRPPLERMLRIHDELCRSVLVNCTILMKALEVSRKTILRDIAFMRDRLALPIEFDARVLSYRYTHPVNAFPTVHVTEGELLALLVAQRALEQYRGTPFHRQLKVAFEKLTSGMRDRISFSPADELRAVSFKNIGLGKTDFAVFNALSRAVLRQEELVFTYHKSGAPMKIRRHVRPYHLANRENLWYLIGFDLERQALRTFALPRIADVVVSKQHFKRPKDFSPENFFANALSVVSGTGNHLVVIRFAPKVANRVREREWHESQEMRDLPDGGLELQMRLGALTEVQQWILGWGAAAEAVAPAKLRDSIQKAIRALATTYLL